MRCLRCGKTITESYSYNKEERPLCIKCLAKESKALKESEDTYSLEAEKETLYNILLNFIELKGCRATLVFSPSNITRVVEFNDKTDLANTRFESYIELLNSPASIEETEDGFSIIIDTGDLEFEEEDIDSFVTDLTMEDSTVYESVEGYDELNDAINKVLKDFSVELIQSDNLTAQDLLVKEDETMYKVSKIIYSTSAPLRIDDLELVYKCVEAQADAMVKEYPEVSEYSSINFFDVITESILREDTQYDMDLEDANARLNSLIKDMQEYVKAERESGCPEDKLKQLIKSNRKGFTRQLTLILDRSHLNQEDESKAREAIEKMMSTLEFDKVEIKASENKEVDAYETIKDSEENKSADKVSESLKPFMHTSPKRYVYEICDYLGWTAPMFIDSAPGGYRIRYKVNSKEEAEKKLNELLSAGEALGIKLLRPRIKEAGICSVGMAEYEALLDKYGIENHRERFSVFPIVDKNSPNYDKFRKEAYYMSYYFAAVAPRYESSEVDNNLEGENADMNSKRAITKEALSLTPEVDAYETIKSCLKYNGAEYRGARIPSAIDGYINQCNLPDEMRLKYYDISKKERGGKEIVVVDYECQEAYLDAGVFEDELRKAIEEIYMKEGLEGTVFVEYHLHDREGICSDKGVIAIGRDITENKKIEEKLPKDLARAYNRQGRDVKSRFTDEIDYEKASYTEITPEQAIDYRKQGKVGCIRAIIDGQAFSFRAEDGYCLDSGELPYEKRYTNRSGRKLGNVKEVPFTHLMKVADKIYFTDEDTTFIDDEKMKRRELDPDLQRGWYSKPVYKNGQDRLRGQHRYDGFDKEDRKRNMDRIANAKQMLKNLQDKYDAGDLSRNEFEKSKARWQSDLDYYTKAEYQSRKHKNEPTAYDVNNAQRNVYKFNQLKSNANYAKKELAYAQKNLADVLKNDESASEFEYYRNALARAKEKLEAITHDIEYYEQKLSKDNVSKVANEYSAKVDKLAQELADTQAEINKMLKR